MTVANSSINDPIEIHVRAILKLIGEKPNREGLKDTPKRVARAYRECFRGLTDPPPKMTVFKNEERYDEMVCETNIHFNSFCEHHLLPFIGVVHIGYIPRKHYVGLSKMARLVDHYAARPQVQERLTCQIADWMMKELKPLGCMVTVEAEHLCMSIRGVKKPRHLTTTSAIRGDDFDKEEFLAIIRGSKLGHH